MTLNAFVNAKKSLWVTALLLGSLALAQQTDTDPEKINLNEACKMDQATGTMTCDVGGGAQSSPRQPANTTPTVPIAQQAPTQPSPVAPKVLDAETQKVLEQAQADLAAGKLPEAVRGFETVIAKDFSNYSAHFGLGLALYRQNDWRGAAFEFTQLTALDALRYEGWYNLGVARDRLGQNAEAAQAFAKSIEVGKIAQLSPADLRPAYMGQARALRAQNQFDIAAVAIQAGLKDIPGDGELTTLLADSLLRANKPLEALPVYYEILAKDPANLEATSQIADIYVSQQLPQRAIRELDRGIAASSDNKVKAQFWLKKSTLLQGREQQAALQEAIRLDATIWTAHYNLGVSRLREGNIRGALEAFQAAYAQNPDEARVSLGIANAYDRLGQSAEAGRFAAIAAKGAQGTDRLEALFLQGKSAYNQRRFPEAVESLATVTQAQADRADAWFFLGVAQFNLREFNAAASSLDKARTLQPNNAATAANLGAALYSAGRFEDAERALVQATTLDARNAVAWYNLGLTLRSMGKQADARRALQRSSELGYAPAKELLR